MTSITIMAKGHATALVKPTKSLGGSFIFFSLIGETVCVDWSEGGDAASGNCCNAGGFPDCCDAAPDGGAEAELSGGR
jgi:hypothetical protein